MEDTAVYKSNINERMKKYCHMNKEKVKEYYKNIISKKENLEEINTEISQKKKKSIKNSTEEITIGIFLEKDYHQNKFHV